MNDIPIWYIALMFGIVLTLHTITKRWVVSMIIPYIGIIIGETLLFRESTTEAQYNLHLFWSYGSWEFQGVQVIANILLFIPLGILLGILWDWKGIIVVAGISLLIETAQLVTHVGLFELDDIFHNAAGAAIGYGIYILLKRVKRNREKSQ